MSQLSYILWILQWCVWLLEPFQGPEEIFGMAVSLLPSVLTALFPARKAGYQQGHPWRTWRDHGWWFTSKATCLQELHLPRTGKPHLSLHKMILNTVEEQICRTYLSMGFSLGEKSYMVVFVCFWHRSLHWWGCTYAKGCFSVVSRYFTIEAGFTLRNNKMRCFLFKKQRI